MELHRCNCTVESNQDAPFFRCPPSQIITVLAPLVIGKVFRETVSGTKAWAKRWNICLSLTSNFMIIMIVWQTLSRGQEDLTSVAYDQILSVVAAGVALHVM